MPVDQAAEEAGIQPGLFRAAEHPRKPLETRAASVLVFGKVAEEGASQETGPRRNYPLAFRGERRSYSCLFPHWHALA
jgi:hypothetical protein